MGHMDRRRSADRPPSGAMRSRPVDASGVGGASPPPNLVYILADDLGYGDVACLNPERGRIPTPCVDALAGQGMVFADMHSPSSVCTPTRYGILTGRYCWRTRLQSGVTTAYAPPLIARGRLTVPEFLRRHGYHTACFGKWHLGMTWPRQGDAIDFGLPIEDGPVDCGFDTYFGVNIPNWGPFCFIEDRRCLGTLSERMPKANPYGDAEGPMVPGWRAESILPTLTERASQYLLSRAGNPQPFFVYLALTSPHTPLAVNAPWQGCSGLNAYADFVMETDAMVGRVLDALERSGHAGNTLVVFTSDNGCAPYIGVQDLERQGHYPSARFRGYKADAWDGGHRIPFVTRWPGAVRPGSRCDQLACLTDLMATCAEILEDEVPDNAGEDSVSMLPLLRGADRAVRETVVHHSLNGRFAIRDRRWKLVLCAGSGGWSAPRDDVAREQGLPPVQLYDMQADPSETANLQAQHLPEVARLAGILSGLADNGRSTLGAPQSNDVPVDVCTGASLPWTNPPTE